MSRWHSYFNSARGILEVYKGDEPFASFSRKYFAAHKKFGSADRKWITHLCYCYFRLGKGLSESPVDDRIMLGLFLCSTVPNELLQALKPDWNENTSLSIEEKIAVTGLGLEVDTIFPWYNELSPGIDKKEFILSHFKQPDLFLRLRPGKKTIVLQKLQQAGIEYCIISDTCLALPNSSKVDKVLVLDTEAVVQDYSSQRVAEFLILVRPGLSVRPGLPVRPGQPAPILRGSDRVWDCCAGSGGKSILAKDILGDIEVTVSDVRESILINLKKRFKAAGINKFNSFIVDLANSRSLIPNSPFQLVFADIPCTGSGTWSRTPEQLYYFDVNAIDEYATLQKRIISNTIPHLKPGGYLLYITCSVFQKENELMVEFIKEKFQLQQVKMELFKGYDIKADSIFAALLLFPEKPKPLQL